MKRFQWVKILVLVLAAAFLLAACGGEKGAAEQVGISLTDGLGRTVTLEGTAQRIVSLAPSNTEILFAIGAGSQVVGRDDFSDYPAEAAQVTSVGGMSGAPSNEVIVSLEPDLVLVAEIQTAEQVKALEELGLNVYYLKNPTDLEGMFENLLTVAALTGKTAETEKLVAQLKERVAAVEKKLEGVSENPLVFYELDATDMNAPFTSGPGTFVDKLMTRVQATNLGSSLASAWAQISLEDLVVRNPDVIILGDALWGGYTAESVAQRPGWDGLSAVQSGKVYPFDDNLVSRPGPRLVDGLEQLAQLLHPEQFK